MLHSLFPAELTPTTDADANDGGSPGISTATGLIFGINGNVTGIRFYATTTVDSGATYTVELWQMTDAVSGTRIGSKAVAGSAITAGTWNVVSFDAPVAVTTGVAYRAALNCSGPAGRYVSTNSFFTSAGYGDVDLIYAWQHTEDISAYVVGMTSVINGTFEANSAANVFPNENSSGTCYFVDVVFDDGEGDLTTPTLTLVSSSDPTFVGATDGSITVSWDAIEGADRYAAGIAPGPSADQGDIDLVDEDVTSPYTFTGLSAGSYTVAIKAVATA